MNMMQQDKENVESNQNPILNSSELNRAVISKLKKTPLFVLVLILLLFASTILLVVFFLLNGQSNESKSEDVARLSKEAQDAYGAGDFSAIVKKMEEAHGIMPDDPRAQATLIKAIANQGNLTGSEEEAFNKAKPYIEEALETNPHDKEVLLAIGYAYETSGEFAKALGYYEQALGVNAKDPQALFHKGHVLEFLGKQDEAFQIYSDAYSINPTHPEIVMAYAKVQLLNGNQKEASDLYSSVSELPDANANLKAEGLTNAAIIARVDLQDLKSSIEYSTKAIQFANNFSPALAEHGFNLAMNNQLVDGIDYMLKAIEANPRISQNYWRVGGLYRLNGDYDSALRYQNEALTKIGNDNTILNQSNRNIIKAAIEYDLATTNLRLGNNDKVIPLLTQAVNDNPGLKKQLRIDLEKYLIFESLDKDEEILNLTL